MRELDDWICGAFFKLSVHDACSLLYLFLLLSFLWVFQFLCHFLLSQIALAMAFVTWRDWAVQRVKLWTNRDTFKPVVEYALHAGHFGLWVSIRLDLSTTTKHVWSYETESCIEILSISFWCVACFFLFHHHIFLISCVLFFGLFHHLIRLLKLYFATISSAAFYINTLSNARAPCNACRMEDKKYAHTHKRRVVARRKMLNVTKISTKYIVCLHYLVFSYFNVYYTSGAFFSLGFNGFFLFTSLVWIKLSLLLIAIYVDYWEIVFCSCSAVFAYFSPALHSLGRLFVPFVHASAHVYKKNCMCVCVTQKLVHRLKRVMNSQLLW